MRCTLTWIAVLAVVAVPVTAEAVNFDDATKVNLLQQRNVTTASWLVGVSDSSSLAALDFPGDERGWRISGNGSVYTTTFDFAKSVTIGAVSYEFRDVNHWSDYLTFSFAHGGTEVYSVTLNRGVDLASGYHLYNLPTDLTVTSVTVTGNVNSPVNTAELDGLGVYLAAGQSLAIDGTFNIFYQENAATTLQAGSFAGAAIWAATNRANTSSAGTWNTGGQAVWKFEQEYEFYGAYINHCYTGNGRWLDNAQVWVSRTGEDNDWTPLNADPVVGWARGDLVADEPVIGNWVKLEWGPGGPDGREISSFQLFGKAIPEPATMSLLAIGGLAMLRRRRGA
jgi:hypothetical protein